MKSVNQIKAASEAISHLKDYIVLAQTEKKLKSKDRQATVAVMIEEATAISKAKVEEL